MPTAQLNGIIYTTVSDTECVVGTDNKVVDSNAVVGDFNPFLRFPETVDISGKKYLVTAVGNTAFRNNKLVKTIRIHRYIKKLKYRCFDWCTSCYKITFDKESNLESLEESSLNGLIVTSINIPKTVKIFEIYCFAMLNNLKTLIYFGTTNPSSSINILSNTAGPNIIYVGLDYPYTVFHDIPVTKVPYINEKLCSNCRCKKLNGFKFIMIFIIS